MPKAFKALLVICLLAVGRTVLALGQTSYIAESPLRDGFAIVEGEAAANVLVDASDYAGVIRAAGDLRTDIGRVTGRLPALLNDEKKSGLRTIVIGTIGKSPLINRLAAEHKIDVSQISGKWETFLIQVVPNPLPGIETGLVIAGSDKRGTIFGIYDLSEQIGVSPWYWWDGVSIKKKNAIFVKPGRYTQGPPSVKYRGIFLNDEAPDLSNWVREKYGVLDNVPGKPANYGHAFYTNIFELILRLKGNYLWPAMWNSAFNEDDPQNPILADEYGIVMGTTHQEPMLRAQKEWDRRYQKTLGSWNYAKHPKEVENFWREGLRRNKNYESIITLGLRGANDTPMAPGGLEANRALLEKIIGVQREMISEELNPDPAKVPQLWCLYKEVQDFYNAGMRVPDDVTLLWADDNWGNVRRLPTAEERRRSGGAGIYYHFDYHGGPRSYQWINTTQISKIWDQLSLAKEYGADRIWIVNVGHLKGYEFPLEYFMNLAWDTERPINKNFSAYTHLWASREFGPKYAGGIAEIISKCSKYNARRKPELLDPSTFSLVNYQEFECAVDDFNTIATQAEGTLKVLPEADRDSFYDLVAFPAQASAQLYELYLAAAQNALCARQGWAYANDLADQVIALFDAHTHLMNYYNHTFAGGKWDHFMDQSHIGYQTWRDPPSNNLAAIKLTRLDVPVAAAMGVAVEGSEAAWPSDTNQLVLPQFDAISLESHWIQIFNKGKTPFEFSATSSDPWIKFRLLTDRKLDKGARLWLDIDWSRAPKGKATGAVTISGAGSKVAVRVDTFNPTEINRQSSCGFVESEGVVAIEPEHYRRKTDSGDFRWSKIEDYGRTGSGMRAEGPVDATTSGTSAPCLEYQMYLFHGGKVDVESIVSPTLNFVPGRGVRFGVSFDDDPIQEVTLVPKDYNAQNGNRDWERVVEDNARYAHSTHTIAKPGNHVLKIWMIDPGVILEKLIVNLGGLRESYLGPPESYYKKR